MKNGFVGTQLGRKLALGLGLAATLRECSNPNQHAQLAIITVSEDTQSQALQFTRVSAIAHFLMILYTLRTRDYSQGHQNVQLQAQSDNKLST